MLRVGRRVYKQNGTFTDPQYPNFTPILVLTKSTQYGSLGPYELKDERSYIMENIWQAAKTYPSVPAVKAKYSRYDPTIIWDYPATTFVRDGEILPAYWAWRDRLMKNKYPVRYPAGYTNRKNCLYAIHEDAEGNLSEPLDYIPARKVIYTPLYCRLVKQQKQFKELQERLQNGENLLIIEVDGPHQESLGYYIQKYGVGEDFIEKDTMLVTEENIQIMLNDPKHPFGHGYCLAMALLDTDAEWLDNEN